MNDTLKRRLDTEMKVEKVAQEAVQAQERIVQTALGEARSQGEGFAACILELHRGFIDKARERASLEAAIARFLDPRR